MIHVAKLGGSLLDLPDLVARFEQWRPNDEDVALVVGGGDAADAVRAFDKRFELGDERGHWLAVRAMQFNTHLVSAVLREACVVTSLSDCEQAWTARKLAVIDPLRWLEREERESGRSVPHRWSFTSDSIAAHVATMIRAERLTLLKSTLPDDRNSLVDIVDDDFAHASASVPHVELVNLRAQPIASCRLR